MGKGTCGRRAVAGRRSDWRTRLKSLFFIAVVLLPGVVSRGQTLDNRDPLAFFTNVSERLIHAQFPNTGLSITNIPVFQNGSLVYSPAVNRLLQLAANMYDATTNGAYPTIFRPYFRKQVSGTFTNVLITGFDLVNGPNDTTTPSSFLSVPLDLTDPNALAAIGTTTH